MSDATNNVEKSAPVTRRKEDKDMTEQTKSLTRKLTAADLERGDNLPPRLTAIGKEIEAKVSRADNYQTKADDMIDSIKELLAEAKGYCDKDGFNAFRKHYCPSLGKSRAYELLAIVSGKKSVEKVKADNAARQAKHKAKLKAATIPLVTEGAQAPLAPLLSESPEFPDAGHVDDTCITPDQKPGPAKPRSAVKSKDEALSDFSARVMDLIGRIAKQRVERFAATSVPEDDLAKFGKFLMDLASLKKSGVVAVHHNSARSAEIPEDEMRAKMAALDPTERAGDVT